MEIEKDLTADLDKLEAKDRFYLIKGEIIKMFAPQDATLVRPFTYQKNGWGSISRVESNTDGTPIDQRAPRKRRRVRTGEIEIKDGPCWSFKTAKVNIDGKEEDHIFLQWSGQFGVMKRSLTRSLEAQNRMRYDVPPLGLMRVYPNWLDLGAAPAESMKEGAMPQVVLETRHSPGRDVMVEVFFDYVEGRPFQFLIEVDSENPINDEKFIALLKTLNTLDVVGPSKRGQILINSIAKVKVTPDELKMWQKGAIPN